MSEKVERFVRAAKNRRALVEKAASRPSGGLEAFPDERPIGRDGPEQSAETLVRRRDYLVEKGVAQAQAVEIAQHWIAPRPLEAPRSAPLKRERLPEAVARLPDPARVRLERLMGADDSVSVAFLSRAQRRARAVGRIGAPRSAGGIVPEGTGFLVGPGVLMTNAHVLPDAATAAKRAVELDYEEDDDGNARLVQRFALDPESLFLVSKDLDVAVVGVAPRSAKGVELAGYGAIPVRDRSDSLADGVGVVVIQHPRGEMKRIALRENEVDYLDDTWVHYQADTDPGSSGSPVLDMELELVALHHSGVPRVDASDQILTRDGAVWDGDDTRRVDWIANEGVRVERICAWLQTQRDTLADDWRARVDAVLAGTAPLPKSAPVRPAARPISLPQSLIAPVEGAATELRRARPASEPRAASTGGGPEMRWVIPLEVTVRVLPTQVAELVSVAQPARVDAASAPEEALRFDDDYAEREGYDPAWIEGYELPLPTLSDALMAAVSRDSTRDDEDRHVLRYHHYSVVHHRLRRMAIVVAANTTRDPALKGTKTRKALGADRWVLDPRIPASEQITERELYVGTPFDLGHLFMREDGYWGDDEDLAEFANADTFHYTNCTPQHERFNRSSLKGDWGRLEAHIAKELKSESLAMSLFAGPVLADDDPEFRGVQIPRRFWKVLATLDDEGELAAFAFVLSQEELLRDMRVEAFSPGSFREFQVPITEVEAMTGLRFSDALRDADRGPEREEELEAFRPLHRRER